jgi:phospholipase/carboxylesterase
LIAGFIDELILNYSIDAKAVSLLASAKVLSKLCYFITSRKISKVIALSGYLNEEIIEENYRNNDFSKLNIFASHGVVDQVIPVTWENNTLLDALGIESIYKDIGHGISPQIFADFKTGCNKQKKVPNLEPFFILIKSDLLQKKYYRHCLRNI